MTEVLLASFYIPSYSIKHTDAETTTKYYTSPDKFNISDNCSKYLSATSTNHKNVITMISNVITMIYNS